MKQDSTFKIIVKLISFMKHLTAQLIMAIVFAVAGFIVTVAIPYIISFTALYRKINLNVLIVLIILALLRGLFRYGEHYFGHYVAFRVLADYRKTIFRKLRNLAPSLLDGQNSGQLLKMIGEDIEALEVFFAHTLAPITTASISFVIMAIFFFNINYLLMTIVLITYVFLALIFPILFAKKLDLILKQNSITRNKYMNLFLESLSGSKELMQFNQSENYFNKINQASEFVYQNEKRITMLNGIQNAVTFSFIGLMLCIYTYSSYILIIKSLLDFNVAVLSLVVFVSSFAPFLELSRLPLGLKKSLTAAREIFNLLDLQENIYQDKVLSLKIEDIKVSNLSFSYPKRNELILEELDFNLDAKKIVGIIGESGSGKSTLVKLLMKWYMQRQGKIVIDSIDIEDLNAYHHGKNFVYIPQNPVFFAISIRENLRLYNKDINDQMIMEALDKCNIKERVLELKDGLDTVFKYGIKMFSDGELQRLELARAFLKNANCYIFDEPTSNLDSLNEAIFIDIVKKHCDKMVFLISHRLSTVMFADEIYEVKNKKIFKIKEK